MISNREFEQLVEKTLGELPRRFAELLDNVVVLVEPEPGDEDVDLLDDDSDELLGVFRNHPPLPDQVVIFRGPILRLARNRRDAERQIRETVIHELGHYFGLDDEGMAY
ncbi:MAG TPA: metallopeptidase family protein [Thermoanaerobaculia bacterium]|nr:metallopeptidase family protein [Thermoanaerobaculia bacterium]